MGESQATTMGLKTALTDMLGIEAPIIQGGMQHVGTAEMASAVSNAGGLGILTGLTQESPEALRKEIRRCRTMTDKPFGVNLTILPMLIPADYDGYAAVVAEERVTMVEIAGGNPKTYIKLMHDNGVKVLHKSATIRHALKAQAAGVDLIEVLGSLSNATRVFKNDVTEAMLDIESESASGGVNFNDLKPFADGARTAKMWKQTGDWNDSMWSCGQSVGLINDVPTCSDLIQRMVKEAEEHLAMG